MYQYVILGRRGIAARNRLRLFGVAGIAARPDQYAPAGGIP
jgi:hypothetical protein